MTLVTYASAAPLRRARNRQQMYERIEAIRKMQREFADLGKVMRDFAEAMRPKRKRVVVNIGYLPPQ